jgi:hypothetical protein
MPYDSMPELKEMPVRMQEKPELQKPSFSRTFSNYSKKLILGTIFTSLIFTSVGCAAGRNR